MSWACTDRNATLSRLLRMWGFWWAVGRWFCRCFVLLALRMLFLIDCRRLNGSLTPIGSRRSSGDRSTRPAESNRLRQRGLALHYCNRGTRHGVLPLLIMPLAGSAVAPLLSPWALQQKGQRLGVSRTKTAARRAFYAVSRSGKPCPNRGREHYAPPARSMTLSS